MTYFHESFTCALFAGGPVSHPVGDNGARLVGGRRVSRRQNLPSILRGIASDEQIRTVFDLQAINEAADEIERLRDIVCEYELREAENTLTPEEVEAILDHYTRQPFTPKIPDVDTGADGNNNQAKDKQ